MVGTLFIFTQTIWKKEWEGSTSTFHVGASDVGVMIIIMPHETLIALMKKIADISNTTLIKS